MRDRSTVDLVKERLGVEEVISSYMKLEKAGKNLKGRCPFHNEKTASFFVSPERGSFYCFGCGAKGDIFTFVEQFEGLDFKGALKVLAEKAGVVLVYDQKTDSDRDRLFRIMEEAAKYFEAELAKAGPVSEEARAYLQKRGLAPATIKEFRIGFAPEGWRNLYAYLRAKQWPNDLIERAGLAKRAEDNTGNYYDRFRGRVMFPISDSSGRIIAFTGRILPRLDDKKAGKYLNSPDTPIFDKSAVLFGLDKAKGYIRRLGYSIMVEGQFDLIMSHQAGVRNVVAASGTALADSEMSREGVINNLGLLRRLSDNVIIAFDSDAAGRKAAMRAAGIALSLSMDVKVADIQGGKDPADLVLADPEDWKNALRRATPIVQFELTNVMRESADPRKVPKALRERVFPFIAVMENQTDRAYAVKLISDKADLPESAIWDDVRAVEKKLREEAGTAPARTFGARGGREVDAAPAGADVGRAGAVAASSTRLDLVERRMMGLLDLMEREHAPKAPEYRTTIEKIAGGAFVQMVERMKPAMADISFEAEALFGSEPERWGVHMADLIANFEDDLVAGDLIRAMTELRQAEKRGDQAAVAEMAQRCQALSIRKAEMARNRKK